MEARWTGGTASSAQTSSRSTMIYSSLSCPSRPTSAPRSTRRSATRHLCAEFMPAHQRGGLCRQGRNFLFGETKREELLPRHLHFDARVFGKRLRSQVIVLAGHLGFPEPLGPGEKRLLKIIGRLG